MILEVETSTHHRAGNELPHVREKEASKPSLRKVVSFETRVVLHSLHHLCGTFKFKIVGNG